MGQMLIHRSSVAGDGKDLVSMLYANFSLHDLYVGHYTCKSTLSNLSQ